MESAFEVKRSKVMIDLEMFDKFEWYDDPGWGLFQKVDGMRSIKFLGPEIISVPIETLKRDHNNGSMQWSPDTMKTTSSYPRKKALRIAVLMKS